MIHDEYDNNYNHDDPDMLLSVCLATEIFRILKAVSTNSLTTYGSNNLFSSRWAFRETTLRNIDQLMICPSKNWWYNHKK